MLSGLAGGHSYVHHEHVAGHGLIEPVDHFSIADAETVAIFVSEAMSHGGPSGQHSHSYALGHLGDVPGLHGWVHASNGDPGRKFNLPGIQRNLYSVSVKKWPHGPFVPTAKSITEMVKPLKERILRAAARLGLVPCPGDPKWNPRPIDGNKPIEKTLTFLASDEPFGTNPNDRTNPADFWWEGADGVTYLLRMFFQHKSLKDLPGSEKFRTYTVLSLAVRWAKKTNDCQTDASFSVWAKPYNNIVWKPVWTQVRLHRHMCEELAEDTNLFLSRYPAPPAAIKFREQLQPHQLEPYNPLKVPTPALVVPSGIVPVLPTFVGNGENVVMPDGTPDPRI
jgi:hypothetical protein